MIANEIQYPIEIFDNRKYDKLLEDMKSGVLSIMKRNMELRQTQPKPRIKKPETSYRVMKKEIPFWEKSMLTLEEAGAYFGIGVNKLRRMTEDENCDFVVWSGSKRLIKKRKFEEYLDKAYSI